MSEKQRLIDSNAKIIETQKRVNEVKETMHKNIELTIERNENIASINSKAEELSLNAINFEKNSRKLKNKMWWQKCRSTTLIVFVVLVIIIVIILIIWGMTK